MCLHVRGGSQSHQALSQECSKDLVTELLSLRVQGRAESSLGSVHAAAACHRQRRGRAHAISGRLTRAACLRHPCGEGRFREECQLHLEERRCTRRHLVMWLDRSVVLKVLISGRLSHDLVDNSECSGWAYGDLI